MYIFLWHDQSPVVQSIVRLMNLLSIDLLTDLKYAGVFLLKNLGSFCSAKATNIHTAKTPMWLPKYPIQI